MCDAPLGFVRFSAIRHSSRIHSRGPFSFSVRDAVILLIAFYRFQVKYALLEQKVKALNSIAGDGKAKVNRLALVSALPHSTSRVSDSTSWWCASTRAP
jgi:hypothetical protein